MSDREANAILELDAASLAIVRTFTDTGFGPWGLALTPDGKRLFTGNFGAGTVTAIDVETGKQSAQTRIGLKPSYVALSADGKTLFATGNLTKDVWFVDAATLKPIRSLEVGIKPMGVAVSPDGRWLYVGVDGSGKVAKVDLKHDVVLENHGALLAVTTNIVLTPNGKWLLAAGLENRLVVMNTSSGDVQKVKVGREPAAVAITPDGSTVFVANYGAGTVSLVDLDSGEAYDEIPVGRGPIDVLTDGRRLITCNDQAGSISVHELSPIQAVALPPAAPVGGQ